MSKPGGLALEGEGEDSHGSDIGGEEVTDDIPEISERVRRVWSFVRKRVFKRPVWGGPDSHRETGSGLGKSTQAGTPGREREFTG